MEEHAELRSMTRKVGKTTDVFDDFTIDKNAGENLSTGDPRLD
jgi:hypothetical protein